MNETKIEWCTHTWNPVTGCLHGCEYCYARRQAERWMPHATERPMLDPDSGATGLLSEGEGHPNCWRMCYPTKLEEGDGTYTRSTPYPKGFAPTLHAYAMDYPAKRKVPSAIFVSSMGDLFGEWVPDVWIESVFDACKQATRHTYLFLTKNPGRYSMLEKYEKLPLEGNYWYGTTTGNVEQMNKAADAFDPLPKKAKSFLSIEPLTEDITGSLGWLSVTGRKPYFQWLIIGVMTGPGSKLHQPKREWIEAIVEGARTAGVPVFMKDSLTGIWGNDLIREYPDGMPRSDDKPAPIPHCKECEHVIVSHRMGK